MPDENISFDSVSEAIDEAIARFSAGKPIDSYLAWINGEDRLTEWAYETETFFHNDDYVFLISEDKLFITYDNLLEYYEPYELKLTTDVEILDFIFTRQEKLFEEADAGHYSLYNGLYLTANALQCGQAGFEFSEFNIYNSKEDYFAYLVTQGYIFRDSTFDSHSTDEFVSMFRKNVTDKYFTGNST
jgi:hypothetical protein